MSKSVPSGRDCPVCNEPNMTLLAGDVEKRYYGLDSGKPCLKLVISVYHCAVCDHVEEVLFDAEEEE